MDILIDLFDRFYDTYGYGIFIMIGLVGAAGILGQWSLYVKCGQPGVACIVPFWNVVVFLKIVGRPAWQSVFVVLPPHSSTESPKRTTRTVAKLSYASMKPNVCFGRMHRTNVNGIVRKAQV